MMKFKEEINQTVTGRLAALALIAVLSATAVTGCSTAAEANEDQDIGSPTLGQIEHSEGGEATGEHGGLGETGGEHGRFAESESEGAVTVSQDAQESNTSDTGESEEAGTEYTLDDVYDETRYGARMMMTHDVGSNAFIGVVGNTTNSTLPRVRVEVHQSNGIELGPTNPVDLAPGQAIQVMLPAAGEFNGWTAHAEVGNLEHGAGSTGAEAGGEHGSFAGSEATGEHSGLSGGEGTSEHGSSGGESGSSELNEAAMSSPIMSLDQRWNGVLGDLEVSMQYDAAAESVSGTVKNISNHQLCYVQAEPHLKSGQQTVGELGPEKLGDLNPGQQLNSNLSVSSEPSLAGVAYDGYIIHMETFDCSGPAPIPHSGGEGAEVGSEGSGGEGGEGGSEAGGEHGTLGESSGEHGGSGEGSESTSESGSEHDTAGEEGTG